MDSNFTSPNSVLSKINTLGNPNFPSQSDINTGSTQVSLNNSTINNSESQLSSTNSKNHNNINNIQNPSKGTQDLNTASLVKNSNSTNLNIPINDKNPVNTVDSKTDINANKVTSNIEVKDDGGWLKNQLKEMASNKTKETVSDGTSNLNQDQTQMPPKTDIKNPNTKKSTVGKVPALEDSRKNPEVPTINQVKPTSPSISTNLPTPPKFSLPKISTPKFIKF